MELTVQWEPAWIIVAYSWRGGSGFFIWRAGCVAGAGGPQSPKGPMLDLRPGKYQYALRMPGQPARTDTLTVAAGDAWGLLVGPSGDVLPLQMY